MSIQEKIGSRDILQAASTVLAGALIFLTLDFTSGQNSVGLLFIIAIYVLIFSIVFAINPITRFSKKPVDPAKMLKLSGISFGLGLFILFSAIAIIILEP